MSETASPEAAPAMSPADRERQERLIRRMRLVVIVLGILLVIGFFSLVGRILYLAFRGPPQAVSPRPALAMPTAPAPPELTLPLPAGAAVTS
ncbi:MAG TPA: hypothetical protein PK264_03070, partial [Hyphomicrobiaceae bacterium]|nr:hypothetical protein [Hyphomicrobiaceae bacterium]